MKSIDIQKLVLFRYEAGQTQKKIFQDLNDAMSYPTAKRWGKMIRQTGAIDLSKPSGCHRTVRRKTLIQGITRKSKGSKKVFLQKIGACNRHAFLKCL